MNKELFIATSSRRTSSSPKTAASRFWISGLRSQCRPGRNRIATLRHMTRNTDPGMVMGTAGYMSPEQVRGKAVDHRTDIFAFGAILYEMLTGKRAFRRSTSAETMTAILNDDPPAISQLVQSIPQGLQRVVHHCLEKNPEQRFHSASDLAFALEALSESGSIPAVAARGARDQRRRSNVLLWSAGLVVVLTLRDRGVYRDSKPVQCPRAASLGVHQDHSRWTFEAS